MDILGKKNVDALANSIHFLILCIVLKMKFRYRPGGAFAPGPPAEARDSLYVVGAPSPPRKKSWRRRYIIVMQTYAWNLRFNNNINNIAKPV